MLYPARSHTGSRERDYELLLEQARSLWEKDLPLWANLANASALLKQYLERTNWVGFYLWDSAARQLVLGPFQGLPACTRINFGRGVCGTAVKARRTQIVPDVHLFPGHIACDSASRSEIVVPLLRPECSAEDAVLGVLDADSPEMGRFDKTDRAGLEAVAALLVSLWPSWPPGIP
jgi:L-methionine (R)-S-oxide reductase